MQQSDFSYQKDLNIRQTGLEYHDFPQLNHVCLSQSLSHLSSHFLHNDRKKEEKEIIMPIITGSLRIMTCDTSKRERHEDHDDML